MESIYFNERIQILTAKIDELEQQLSEQLVTNDVQIIDNNDRVRIRMFTDDENTSRLEFYEENGQVGTCLSITADGESRFVVNAGSGGGLQFGVKQGHLGTVRITNPPLHGYPSNELVIGESDGMMVGFRISVDNSERMFAGIDSSGEPKIRMTNSNGSVTVIEPDMS